MRWPYKPVELLAMVAASEYALRQWAHFRERDQPDSLHSRAIPDRSGRSWAAASSVSQAG